MLKSNLLIACAVALCAGPAYAECTQALTVKFVESAPRDRFEIIHTATGVFLTGLQIDLRGSSGALVFDTEQGGAGVDVFQPFQPGDGVGSAQVADGATQLAVSMNTLSAGKRTGFSIDVDDQLTQSDLGQTRVTGGELSGARVVFSLKDGSILEAMFDDSNRAKICT